MQALTCYDIQVLVVIAWRCLANLEDESSEPLKFRDKKVPPAPPTLEDVAEMACVSTATVSRYLNAPDKVSEATRLKVRKAVEALGYAPNFGAQALAARRTNTFGAIIPTMENAIFARGLQAFQEELRLNGVTLLVASSSYKPELEEDQIRTLVARGAEAVLLIGHDRTARSYDFLNQRQIPFVSAWVYDENTPRLSVGFDNCQAIRTLTEAVMDLGHRNLGYITADPDGNDRARARLDGVRRAMASRGLDPDALQIETTTYSIDHGGEAFEHLMRRRPRATAVLCGNDVFAAGALLQARKLGIRVPQDVSITGFDDIEVAGLVTPGLTTVHVPHREMGRRAARMLLAIRAGEDPGPSIELPTMIKWRESLAAAPAPPSAAPVSR